MGAGAGALATAVVAAPLATAEAEPDTSLVELEVLLAAHEEAITQNNRNWEKSDDLDTERSSKVRVGYVLRGLDDDGNDIKEPIFAYSVESILEHYERSKGPALSIWGSAPDGVERVRKINERYEEITREKIDEFLALEAEKKRREDASGYTAALAAAEAATAAVREIEARIMAFAPQSLAAARRLAQWALASSESNRHCFDGADDLLTMVLGTLAKGVQS